VDLPLPDRPGQNLAIMSQKITVQRADLGGTSQDATAPDEWRPPSVPEMRSDKK
jgi:hypothetical protein